MPVNAGYEYVNAEKKYLDAQTLDQKIVALEEMIRTSPKHKSSENLLAGLRLRLKKFLEKKEKNKKTCKSSVRGIKKEGFQCALVGFTNSGKSALLAKLTNAKPKIDVHQFTTFIPEVGIMNYNGIRAQIVDLPSIGSANFDMGIVNTADCLLIILETLNDLEKIIPHLSRSYGKQIVIINKIDLLSQEELRKLQEKVKSKKINGILISCENGLGIKELKEKIFRTMNVIRIYTKEPGKPKSNIPIVLPQGSTVKDVAESILKGFSQKVRETRLTGPSSKFSNQKVGLYHVLKDLDIVEFHMK